MATMIFQLLGGLGLFLLGMTLLTDGLRAFAGSALRDALVRFTGTPAKAFASGALVTLAVQSSSATTVTLIGFVSAGLITFAQAIGVVMGASLGTTGTGWLVSILGLKVDLGAKALPLVGIGALTHLLARGQWRALGLAIAGFGLIFVGIGTLQTGMQSIGERFDPAWLPVATFGGQLVALGIGVVMTVLMQSSSAAVATTLTALHAQAVSFEQAAPLVIGAAIGTTVTGALAAIGGTVPARRTALAHVTFNLATGLIALLLLPALLGLIGLAQRHLGLQPGAVSLAAFHTTFIALGVVVFLPLADPFARAIEWLLPERGPHLTRHLDDSLLSAPPIALEAVHRALASAGLELVGQAQALVRPAAPALEAERIAETRAALEEIERFLARIPATHATEPLSGLHVAQLHALDHLKRLTDRLELATRPRPAAAQAMLAQPLHAFGELLGLARRALSGEPTPGLGPATASLAQSIVALHEAQRTALLRQTAAGGEPGPLQAMATLDALRWTERTAHHVWRICHYLVDDAKEAAPVGQAPARTLQPPALPGS